MIYYVLLFAYLAVAVIAWLRLFVEEPDEEPEESEPQLSHFLPGEAATRNQRFFIDD